MWIEKQPSLRRVFIPRSMGAPNLFWFHCSVPGLISYPDLLPRQLLQVEKLLWIGLIYPSSFSKMNSCGFADEKFDITHIKDLYASPTKLYLGIWMSLETSMEDLTIETGKPIKSRIPIVSMLMEIDPAIPSQTLKNKTPSRRGPPRASKSYIESATNPRKLPKRARTDDGENIGAEPREDKLRFRLRGFRSTYNSSLPPDELECFTDRHQCSTSVSGLYYDSEFVRDASMRIMSNNLELNSKPIVLRPSITTVCNLICGEL